jgi:hypothetical protein
MYQYGNQFNAVNIATSLHRLASNFRFDVRRYGGACRIVLDRARETDFDGFSPRELANVVWAMAKTEMPCKEDIIDHIAIKAIRCFTDADFTPQAIANLLWGMAKAGYPNAPLFEHLAGIACRSGLRGFNAQNLSNSLWALSTAQLPNDLLFRMIGDFIVAEHTNLKGFSPQNMANAVWAMAKVNMPHYELFTLISVKASESHFDQFKPQEIANLVWAMSTCELIRTDLVREVYKCVHDLSEWKPQEISNITWACAVGQSRHSELEIESVEDNSNYSILRRKFVKIVTDETVRRGVHGWKPSELSNLIYGLITLGCRDTSVLTMLVNKVKRDGLMEWKQCELNLLLSALVIVDMLDSDLLTMVVSKAFDLYNDPTESPILPSPSSSASDSCVGGVGYISIIQ